jgi:hypothetical protein
MPDVLSFSSGDYIVEAAIREPPLASAQAALREDFGLSDRGTLLVVSVGPANSDHRSITVSQHFAPGPEAGFQPGLLIVPETHTLFIGAGTRLLAYHLRRLERLWQDESDTGFWSWRRHGEIVLMSAELEFAAWDLEGHKLWSTFVEPPWTYSVAHGSVMLDVMGQVRRFPLRLGPRDYR